MSSEYLDLQYMFYMVDERPLCIWGNDIRSQTINFIDSVDSAYFEFMADLIIQNIQEGENSKAKESQYSAIAIRALYSQAIETLFSFICALVQAPLCIPAWINSYKISELRHIVKRIDNYLPVYSQIKSETLSWTKISEVVFSSLILEDKIMEQQIKKEYSDLWARLAHEFLDDGFITEYNSIKHGLRVRMGGFHISIGPSRANESTDTNEKIRLIGKSEFGSRYLSSDAIGKRGYHLQLIQHHRNWNPEDMCFGLKMISMSLKNIQSSIKIINGISANKVQFQWPSDMDMFNKPWEKEKIIGVTSLSGGSLSIREEFITPFTKEEIKKRYIEGKYYGKKRLQFRENK
jgi:hypothetical protein